MKISADISVLAKQSGEHLASDVGPIVGSAIWDICFDKSDALRSASVGAGHGLMGTLRGSSVGPPQSFTQPRPSERHRQTLVKKLKRSSAICDAVKHEMSEGQYPGMSEEEAIDKLSNDLLNDLGAERPAPTGPKAKRRRHIELDDPA